MIKAQGLSLEAVRKRIREQLLVERMIRRKVSLRVSVTEEEIDRYLITNREKLETGLAFEARHILFVPGAGSGEDGWTAARRRADEIYSRVLAGEDFGDLAREYSEDTGTAKNGGRLGVLKRASWPRTSRRPSSGSRRVSTHRPSGPRSAISDGHEHIESCGFGRTELGVGGLDERRTRPKKSSSHVASKTGVV